MGDLLVVGVTASIGFTVALFFATAAFPGGTALAETKMGALLSFAAAPLAIALARIVGTSSRRPILESPISMKHRRGWVE
jgi:NhaA family Na+:H+ antiporter